MTGRQELIDTLIADFFPPEYFSDQADRSGITVAGIKITSPEAIAKYTRIRLERRLPAVETFKTCEDFRHLDVECCDSCHAYEMYDMDVVPLPEGGYAWICCALDRAIRPEWHAERDKRLAKTAAGKLVKRMFEERN